jgi:hypothetical protein
MTQVVHLWESEGGECPITFLPVYMYNKGVLGSEQVVYSYTDMCIEEKRKEIINDYNSTITNFLNTRTHVIGKDIPDQSQVNIILVPCSDFSMLLHVISAIPRKIYDFCSMYNIKICINYVRECISKEQKNYINEYLERFVKNEGYDIAYIRVIVNAYMPITDSKYNIYINVNLFDKFLYHCIKGNYKYIKKSYPFYEKRRYTFSITFGMLHNRPQRVRFLCACKKNNLINDDLFYSIICTNNKITHDYIQNIIPYDEYEAIKNLVYHKVYHNNGDQLSTSDHIYDDGYEYGIHNQILESYITVVLETVVDMPSITEKIYKPLICGVPSLWLGCRNISEYLTQQGYRLYPFIDYSFDSGKTVEERAEMLIKEMLRLRDINLEYCVRHTQDIAKHNINNFMSKQYTMEELYKQLKNE